MESKAAVLALKIAELERELVGEFERGLERKRVQFHYGVERGRIAFDRESAALHERLRQTLPAFIREASWPGIAVSPVIYSLIVPLALFDVWLRLYQAVCFPVYGIAKVKRERYIVLDRGQLRYLNALERLNCNYCGYANGLIAHAREVASRTEAYFCPIKHSRRCSGAHERYQDFLEFGDAEGYRRFRARTAPATGAHARRRPHRS